MKIIDISWPISEQTTQYKTKKEIKIIPTKTFEKDYFRESLITIGSHSGTHVDSPAHYLQHGTTLDKIPLSSLIGPANVLDLSHINEKITAQDLEKFEIKKDEIILLKTKNSNKAAFETFDPNFIYLSTDGAQFLTEKKVKAVGIDYLGIERNQPGHETHKILLEKNILIIEGLRLKEVKSGKYIFTCLPLLIENIESSPARTILMEINL
ncbi:TPA: cyclase [Candidatus Dependentiae bacterium]|nr:MAG: Arylformamidase [candidate division TM6 bacterium GW2011_GWE2_31_21]KKP54146.1 MAG: Arylformamidase [candidate division TM6 bacterium GW2011_GWF2_33_332]HBS47867.1 cyclase [Candidatus Dependentiae bacterium]HBZ73052.1 cyclase [Candidatus Dependentiae bacterium]